jgi:hypothetical protein
MQAGRRTSSGVRTPNRGWLIGQSDGRSRASGFGGRVDQLAVGKAIDREFRVWRWNHHGGLRNPNPAWRPPDTTGWRRDDHRHWIDYLARNQHGRALLSPQQVRWHEERVSQTPRRKRPKPPQRPQDRRPTQQGPDLQAAL